MMLPSEVPSIMFRVVSSSVMVRAELNGVPVVESAGGDNDDLLVANEWIRPGANSILIRVSWPPDVSYAAGAASVTHDLRIVPPGQAAESVPPACAGRWPGPDESETFPKVVRSSFDVKGFPPSKLWTDCEQLVEVDAKARSEIRRLVESAHEAYSRCDAQAVVAAMQAKASDIAAVFGEDPGTRLSKVADFARRMFETAGWGMEPLTDGELELEFVAERRLLRVTSPGRKPPLISKRTREFRWNLPLYVGRMNGQWIVMR
jgi:hypothetical protein